MNAQNKVKAILTLAVLAMAVIVGTSMAAIPEPVGINPQTGDAWVPGDQYRLVFVTSSNPEGAVNPNIAHYNEVVQNLANAAGLGGAAWYCIGSTGDGDAAGAIDARDNTSTNPEDPNDPACPIYLIDATTLVAVDKFDLWDGSIAHIINQDENGAAKTGWPFTGTYTVGTTSAGKPITTGGPLGTASQVSQSNSGVTTEWIWRQWTGDPPANPHPLYAMSEPLTHSGIDPTKPVVNIGPDKMTWSGEPITLIPLEVTNNGGTPLEYVWTIEALDAEEVVVLTPNTGDPLTSTDLTPTATVTKTNVGGKVTAKVTLTVNNQGDTNYVSDFMLIDVFDNSCDMANAISPVTYDLGDINTDCNVDLLDFAQMAAAWLINYELTAPQSK